MAEFNVNIYDLYNATFGGNSKYFVAPKAIEQPLNEKITYSGIIKNDTPQGAIVYTSKQIALNKFGLIGQEIWHPITFWKSNKVALEIESCTIRVNAVKNIIRTAPSERNGTVKEKFSIDDYKFSIKGFLIGKNRTFPEEAILMLKDIFETIDPVSLHGGYPELFLDDSCRIAIDTLEFPEVTGKAQHIRPFSLTCETDYITDIIIK